MGYTINRVSLFALIFSIGILVDDAIVVVENIVRHWRMRAGGKGLIETAIEAVAEVGNPTIVATLTIIVALLPMMFVSGPDGPIHEPDPRQRLDGDALLLLRCRDDHALAALAHLAPAPRRSSAGERGEHGTRAAARWAGSIVGRGAAAARRPAALKVVPL